MLGKLLRYEFKALLRVLPALYLAIQVLAVAAGLNSLLSGARAESGTTPLEIALGFMFIALLIVSLVIVIMRFRDNFLKDEGYLMFTLPVTQWQLVASKAIAGFCSLLLTFAAGTLALVIYKSFVDSTTMLKWLYEEAAEFGSQPVLSAFNIVTTLVTVFQQLCLVYAAITVSQMVSRFRGLVGVGVYLAVMISEYNIVELGFRRISHGWDSIPYLAAGLFVQTALAALFFCCTCWLLKRTLNLE
jgi:hypothetical protein